MHYDTADMNRCNNRALQLMVEEMRNLPEGVASVENDWDAGTRTYVYKNGRRVSHSINGSSKVKPSAKPSAGSSTASELKASVQKTMREADQNISDFIRRIAQLDVEISRLTMRGKYAGSEKLMRDDLLQRINKLEAVKKRCAALLCGT